MKPVPCVISVADHTGWAHLVGVSVRQKVPAVAGRRRMTLIERDLPTQPYEHESLLMKEDEAEALIARVRRSILACTADALHRAVAELAPAHVAVALAIRKPPFPRLPKSVAAVRASSRLLYAADGMLYHLAICRAARQLGLEVQLCRRGDEAALAAQRIGVTPDAIEAFVAGRGRPAGPPWTEEHRRAYAAGIAALAPHVKGPLQLVVTS